MKPLRLLTSRPILFTPPKSSSNLTWVYGRYRPPGVRLPVTTCMATSSTHDTHLAATQTDVASSTKFHKSPSPPKSHGWEETIEKVIYNCRFLALLAVMGSLIGSILCFIKGCAYVVASFQEYFVHQGRGIFQLVEAIDVYLLGTVMLVFGMGLYELFISNLDTSSEGSTTRRSNLFGLFVLKERPKWLEIKSVNELKTKLGHVIVMLLLIGLFEKSKKAVILTTTDLLCFSGSVLLSSCCLYLLSKLH
ncbi:hypothetical protein M8C21_011393 [Ambrosia artemisiifolia]|uniref:Uncharacterized protein n=1 Tax=Ambrosia artemisiifolia TaxID=4212 RepID=A0AAD5BR71_AMBAR|nr:hypothetical protein M8C21_011393 [Ambrosia artemisiifolia]